MEKFSLTICCLYKLGTIGNMCIKNIKHAEVYHDLMKNRWDIPGIWKLIRIIRKKNIHILYTVNSPLTQFWGTVCAKLGKIDSFLTRITVSKPVSHAIRRLIVNNIMLPFVDVIIAQSKSHKEYLISNEGFKADKMEVIYNGVELERYLAPADEVNLKQTLGIPGDAPVVGIVTRLSPEKGLPVFLNAAKRILDDIADVHFIIAGDGPERKSLEKISHELAIQSNVHFLGMREDIPYIISSFDVAVMASYIENFSNAILEYMVAGKAVVGTDAGGTSEQVIDGQTGFLIPCGKPDALADSILKLLRDRGLAKMMGEAGRDKVKEKFTVEKMTKEYESLFERMLEYI